MVSRLEVIKELRARGASIRMIDDVAAHVGGYESPLFVATVDFIIKIRNMLQSVMVEQKQEITVSTESLEDVSFPAAKTAVQNDDEMGEDERKKMLEHLNVIEQKKDSQMEADKARGEEITPPKKPNRVQEKSRPAKNSLLDRIFKINSQQNAKKQQQENQRTQADVQNNAAKSAARQQQVQQTAQTSAVKQSSVTTMNLIKMKLLNVLKLQKDKSIYGKAQFESKNIDVKKDTQPRENKDKKSTQEVNISKVIDDAVRAAKTNKAPVQEAEKGKFEKQHGQKSGPRADEAKVAEMQAKEAIAKLQNSGVKASNDGGATPKIKKEIDAQVATQQQTSAKENAQKQR